MMLAGSVEMMAEIVGPGWGSRTCTHIVREGFGGE